MIIMGGTYADESYTAQEFQKHYSVKRYFIRTW